MIVCLDKGARAAPVSVEEVDGGVDVVAPFLRSIKGSDICARKIFDTST